MKKKAIKLGKYEIAPGFILKQSVQDKNRMYILDEAEAEFSELEGILARVLPKLNRKKDLIDFLSPYVSPEEMTRDEMKSLKESIRGLCQQKILRRIKGT